MLRKLRECLGLLGTRETLPESDAGSESSLNYAGISELERIIQEIFPQDCPDETVNLLENPDSTPLPCFVSVQEREKELAITSAASTHSMVLEESKDSNFADSKPGGTHPSGLAAPDPVAPVPLQKYEITYEDATLENEIRQGAASDSCPSQLPSPVQKQGNSRVVQEKRSTWILDILKNGVLTADPSRLLTLLLIVSVPLINTIGYHVSVLTSRVWLFSANVWYSQFASIDDRVSLDHLLNLFRSYFSNSG
jgi:hypothetical protein